MNPNKIYTRAMPVLSADQDKNNAMILHGYAARYNVAANLGAFYETIRMGAFDAANFDDVRFLVKTGDAAWAVLEGNLAKLMRMAGATEFVRQEVVEGAPAVVTTLGTLYLDLASTVDAAAEKVRLTKELEAMAKHIAGTEARLGNEAFVSKAPPAVLEGARKQLADQKAKQAELMRLRAALG